MKPHCFTAAFAALALMLPAGAARADEACAPLVSANSIQMTRAPGGDLDLVPVTINGAPRNLVFDTGSAVTQLRRATVQQLKLPVHRAPALPNGNGQTPDELARVQEFVFGYRRDTDVGLHVMPGTARGVGDGILAPDYLSAYVAEVDFGSDILNLLSPDHCPGNVVYWKTPSIAAIPMLRQGSRILVPARLDGRDVEAVIDTGAAFTTLRADIAQRLWGVAADASDAPERGGAGANPRHYVHRFHSLTLAGITVNNPDIDILPNAAAANGEQLYAAEEPSEIARAAFATAPGLALGMDVLRKLHLYFAFAEGMLYVTPATPLPAGTQPISLPATGLRGADLPGAKPSSFSPPPDAAPPPAPPRLAPAVPR